MVENYKSYTKVGEAGLRVISGMTAYDEKLINGRLIVRYCNPCGQVMPEMHLPDSNFNMDIESTFGIVVHGQPISSGWQLEVVDCNPDEANIMLVHKKIPLRVCVKTSADGSGWITRQLVIENTGDTYLPLDSVMPLKGRIWRHCFGSTVENQDPPILQYSPNESGLHYDSLYEIGYSPTSQWGQEGDFGFHPLSKDGVVYDAGMKGRSGWSRPAFVLRDNMNGQLFCCEFAYSGNWEMQIKPVLMPTQTGLQYGIGIKASGGEYVRVLSPGEKVETPEVHFTLCADGMQQLIHARHRFIREKIMPKRDPIGSCLIEANHRGYLCDRENEEDIIKDVSVAAEVGVELYVIDAGWFGPDPNVWYDNVGDWHAGSWFPKDLHPIIDHVKKLGMKFGLWMEIEAAGKNSKLRKEHPEFLMRRYGEEWCNGRALDLSKESVIKWIEQQIVDVITRYNLDMFRIDHNHWIYEGGTSEVAGYTENVMWRYVENLYKMFDRLNKRFPTVSFQNCAAGGGRLDLGILRYFHHTEATDWMRPPRSVRIFNGITTQLPPEIQLRAMGTEVCEHVQDSDLLSQLHNVMQSRMIIRGIAPNKEELAEPLKKVLQEKLELYKTHIRPILTGKCKVFQHAKQNGIFDPTPWSANEFALADGSAVFAVVQRLTKTDEDTFVLRPQGVSRGKMYQVAMDRCEECYVMSGVELAQTGIAVNIDTTLGSELLMINEIKKG